MRAVSSGGFSGDTFCGTPDAWRRISRPHTQRAQESECERLAAPPSLRQMVRSAWLAGMRSIPATIPLGLLASLGRVAQTADVRGPEPKPAVELPIIRNNAAYQADLRRPDDSRHACLRVVEPIRFQTKSCLVGYQFVTRLRLIGSCDAQSEIASC